MSKTRRGLNVVVLLIVCIQLQAQLNTASNIDDIITEIIATKTSERGETRIDDKVSEAAMEDRKKNGYF